ncbi:MAG TPA: Ala-tRNA(Pro) hydrolase [Rhodospirillaceae bacterium]|nr:Ala-tRNA(Pro) hydrolase [Rhodospirillaceae bacterium]MAX61461.1 Ala-tRNA(Pro) hydrolase [Rhodospirillaceae bacterium]MBB59090.1 Ala-tRNA(Pro) hydrolase [Rhodospirillaceae bacterium]HAE00562.1 Ala-tRNA(Pro) hydrolase [Rhodospirillaceae bacterium]HAJ18883.1 Ala-tRNA(Pro) hydrolase [Rhodospirillaceae bacterium]|tara:strand:+ start:5560 stop:6276 length:717 start_codon:yes stop_codon:yes gene_type:complete
MTDRTEELYRDDSYLKSCDATVVEITDRGALVLDRTVFYYTGGGQPGDSGTLTFDGGSIRIGTTIQVDGDILHIPEEGQTLPPVGTKVVAEIDWDRRYRLMKMHTAMHLLCALVPCGVTGGQVGEDKSRLDFDVGEHMLDKDALTAQLNDLIAQDHPLQTLWITDAELDANPELVRTMSVQPPRNAGRIRLVKVGEAVDLQPCGGTHIAHTGEIGALSIGKIENKGAKNRRVNIHLEA